MEGGNKDEGKRGKKRMRERGEDDCRGIGGRLRQRQMVEGTERWRRKGTRESEKRSDLDNSQSGVHLLISLHLHIAPHLGEEEDDEEEDS